MTHEERSHSYLTIVFFTLGGRGGLCLHHSNFTQKDSLNIPLTKSAPMVCNNRLNMNSEKLGNYTFYKLNMAQNPDMPRYLNKFLEDINPTTIIEIGTYQGGLSVLFGLYSRLSGGKFVTYDKSNQVNKELFKDLKIDLRIEDCFDKKSIEDIKSLIKRDGTTLVFCDGGNKIREFNLFSDFLKPGDYIMAHDYAETEEIFKERINGSRWNWLEIKYKDIKESCDRNGLKKVSPEFEDVACACFRKE